MADLFAQKSPGIMRDLMRDFDLTVEETAAILGNIGWECGGFKLMQEVNPTVPGSRGGLGWCQWTGPRRIAFENYCRRNGLSVMSDKANYAWLFVELSGTERSAIPATKRAGGLYNKMVAFENNFERAGTKHYPGRFMYAQRAMAAHDGAPGLPPVRPKPKPKPPSVTPVGGAGGIAIGAAGAAAFTDGWLFHFFVFTAVLGAGVGGFLYVRKNRGRLAAIVIFRMENSSGLRRAAYRFLSRFV